MYTWCYECKPSLINSGFTLQNESNITIMKDRNQLVPGNYYSHSDQPFDINNEILPSRTISQQSGIRTQAFRNTVRSRDQRCVITREKHIDNNPWTGFEAAHIFPLACEEHWVSSGIDHHYHRYYWYRHPFSIRPSSLRNCLP